MDLVQPSKKFSCFDIYYSFIYISEKPTYAVVIKSNNQNNISLEKLEPVLQKIQVQVEPPQTGILPSGNTCDQTKILYA